MVNGIKAAALSTFAIALLNVPSFAQDSGQKQVIDAGGSVNCEYTAAIVDSFVQGLSQKATVIFIGNRGRRETEFRVRSRLPYAQLYLTDYYKTTKFERPNTAVIAAFGLETLTQGNLLFYVDGQLSLEIFFKHNRKLRLSPCVK